MLSVNSLLSLEPVAAHVKTARVKRRTWTTLDYIINTMGPLSIVDQWNEETALIRTRSFDSTT